MNEEGLTWTDLVKEQQDYAVEKGYIQADDPQITQDLLFAEVADKIKEPPTQEDVDTLREKRKKR